MILASVVLLQCIYITEDDDRRTPDLVTNHVYDIFLTDVYKLIDDCMPVKYVTVGLLDPPYITPSSNLCY